MEARIPSDSGPATNVLLPHPLENDSNSSASTWNTFSPPKWNPHDPFYLCWRRNSCSWCLESRNPTCGWCPFSSTCIPTRSLFAPLTNPHICPLSEERFELRTRTFGCPVSTRNFLSTVSAIILTSLFWVLLFGLRAKCQQLRGRGTGRYFYSPSSRRRGGNNNNYFTFWNRGGSLSSGGAGTSRGWFTSWPFSSGYRNLNDNDGSANPTNTRAVANSDADDDDDGFEWGGWYPGWLFWKRRDGSTEVQNHGNEAAVPGGWTDHDDEEESGQEEQDSAERGQSHSRTVTATRAFMAGAGDASASERLAAVAAGKRPARAVTLPAVRTKGDGVGPARQGDEEVDQYEYERRMLGLG